MWGDSFKMVCTVKQLHIFCASRRHGYPVNFFVCEICQVWIIWHGSLIFLTAPFRFAIALSVRLPLLFIFTSNWSKAHETRDSLSSSYLHIVLVYLQSFRRNSPLKVHRSPQPKIAKKPLAPTNTPYFGSSRSFKVIEVDTQKSSSSVFVKINSMSMSICTLDEPISIE